MNNSFHNFLNLLSLFPRWMFALYFFLFGLCIGSFLNVVILRGLKNESFVFSRSKCPKCSNILKWYMNIPLLSFIFLKGRCAYCREKISIQYPIVELLSGVCFLVCYLAFGLSLKTLFLLIIFSVFILFTLTDFLETVIIDYHAYFLLIVGLIASGFQVFDITFLESIMGAVFGFIAFEILSRLGVLFSGQRMFGFGDSLIILGLGSIFGFKNLVLVTILSFVIQMYSAIPTLVKTSLDNKNKCLAVSYVLVFVFVPLLFLPNIVAFSHQTIYKLIVSIVLLFCLKNILGEIKKKKEQLENVLCNLDDEDEKFEKSPFKLLPFGPSLVISAVIALFYLKDIKNLVHILF